MSDPILKVEGLSKSFYKPRLINILNGVDLSVHRGETVAILGRSGEGKSTFLQLLGTLEDPCSGTLKICGQEATPFNKSSIRNRHIGFVFQSFHLLEDYSTLENVLMPAKIGRKSLHEAEKRAISLLERVGLSERIHFPIKLLSGGEKQRVAIARALCNDPELILADEPSGNLDKQTAEIIHGLLLDLAKAGKAVVIVTHDQELAKLCFRKAFLSGCKLTFS